MLPLPAEWDPQPHDESGKEEPLHLVGLAQDTQEYKAVQKMFHQSMRENHPASITNIERIQNPTIFHSYMLRKQTMDEKNGSLENELLLFHGTKSDSVKFINVQGFNRSLCGINGTYHHYHQWYISLVTDMSRNSYVNRRGLIISTCTVIPLVRHLKAVITRLTPMLLRLHIPRFLIP